MTRIETQVIAHRGASRMARENTVEAFRLAAVVGAHAVELDVRRTADEVLVVHHDPMLPDGRLIAGLDAADLPAHIPSLTAALDACTGMWVNVEIKNDPGEGDFDPTDSIADHTVALLQARAEDDRWVISSFRLETVDRCRAGTRDPHGLADLHDLRRGGGDHRRARPRRLASVGGQPHQGTDR